MKKSHLAIAGLSAIALSAVATESKAQSVAVDTGQRRLPTLSINTSDGVSCNGGGGSQPSVNIGTSYGQNGEIRLGAVLVIPLGDNSNPCTTFAKVEEKKTKYRYLRELLEQGDISEEQYQKRMMRDKLFEV